MTAKPAGSTAALSSATVVKPTFTADLDGSYVLSLVVNDGTVNSTADTVTITASTANSAPVANAGPDQNVATGTLVTLDGSASSDADGDTLTHNWSMTAKPAGSTAALSSATVVKPTFTADLDGSYVLSLVVNDGTVNSAADTVTITASTANSAPVANAGPDQNVATGTLVTLDGSASSDADGDTLTHNWSMTAKPAGSTAALSSATVVKPTFTADLDGSYVLSLVVNDGTVNSTADTVTITASTANSAPVANAGPDQNVATGTLVTLDGSASSDADGDTLIHNWSMTSKPAGSAAALSSATVVKPTFTADLDGSYVLSLVVNDGTVNSAADTVTITAITQHLPDTGQTTCYDATGNVRSCASPSTGEDGEYSINPMSFTDNGNGTVSDNVTGLMWQKCTSGQNNDSSCSGTASAKDWFKATGTEEATYNPGGSVNYCGALTLGGYEDWRLPSAKELLSLVNYGATKPALDTTYFPNQRLTAAYWSSNTFAGDTTKAYSVWFDYGNDSKTDAKTRTFYLRCVRGMQYPAQTFTDNGNSTVTDNFSGLIWQKCSAGSIADTGTCSGTFSTMHWQQALDYCNTLNGSFVWRLPSAKELSSILDYSLYDPMIAATYFPNTPAADFWTSTTSNANPAYKWFVDFRDDAVSHIGEVRYHYFYVRCVR